MRWVGVKMFVITISAALIVFWARVYTVLVTRGFLDELEDVQDRIDRTKVSMRREQEQLAESADSRQEEMRALEAEMAQFKEKVADM